MRNLTVMFVTVVCFLFLLKLKWPKNKNIYDDHIWSKLRGFKRENNECVRNGEKTNLHKIKIVVFLFRICGAMTRILS